MPRELTSHKVNGCNDAISVSVLDEPGCGGACHQYQIASEGLPGFCFVLKFQNGPIREAGVNGLTHETLLAVLQDRLEGFQSGPYATADNAEALEHIRGAMECLHRRTKERLARGVEGTHAK